MDRNLSSDDLKQLIMGDQAAFQRIYNLFSERLFWLAFRFLKDTEQSEEIVQETFITLWLNRDKLDFQGNIWLYLYVVSKRLSLNSLRNISQSKFHTDKLLANFKETQNYTEEVVLAHDLESLAKKVVGDLPKQQQIIFRLSRLEGFSHREIGDQLNISPNTVKNHMSTALKTIKSRFSDCGLL